MKAENTTKIQFDSLSINEAYARSVVAAFLARYDPTVPQLADLKTAVSEAVTNCIVHAYRNTVGIIYINVRLYEENTVCIEIRDRGCGIENIAQAREPLFTTDAEGERSGMGFTVMESFCDKVRVCSKCGKGTTITLFKRLARR